MQNREKYFNLNGYINGFFVFGTSTWANKI